jgi:hypothetical protein
MYLPTIISSASEVIIFMKDIYLEDFLETCMFYVMKCSDWIVGVPANRGAVSSIYNKRKRHTPVKWETLNSQDAELSSCIPNIQLLE